MAIGKSESLLLIRRQKKNRRRSMVAVEAARLLFFALAPVCRYKKGPTATFYDEGFATLRPMVSYKQNRQCKTKQEKSAQYWQITAIKTDWQTSFLLYYFLRLCRFFLLLASSSSSRPGAISCCYFFFFESLLYL